MNTDEASAGSIFMRLQPQRHQRAGRGRDEHVHDHRHAQQQSQHRVGLGRPRDARGHGAQRQAVAQADQRFFGQRLARAGPRQLAERQAAHDDGQRLRGRIAAHAGDDRHEHRERRHLLNRAFEQRDHRRGKEGGHQVDAQPRQALANRLARRRRNTLVAGHAGQSQQVFGGFVLDDVDHVIHGDDADELVLFVDDRNRQQVIATPPAAPLLPGRYRRGRS